MTKWKICQINWIGRASEAELWIVLLQSVFQQVLFGTSKVTTYLKQMAETSVPRSNKQTFCSVYSDVERNGSMYYHCWPRWGSAAGCQHFLVNLPANRCLVRRPADGENDLHAVWDLLVESCLRQRKDGAAAAQGDRAGRPLLPALTILFLAKL